MLPVHTKQILKGGFTTSSWRVLPSKGKRRADREPREALPLKSVSHDDRGHSPSPRSQARWPATVALLGAAAFYLVLPNGFTLGPPWVVPALEAVLAVPLTISRPYRHQSEAAHVRAASIGLIALINAANIASVAFLVNDLLAGDKLRGPTLIYAAVEIWVTNAIVFGLWFWEVDRGGPGSRGTPDEQSPDFLFPQMTLDKAWFGEWTPGLVDYLYTGLTNATAFSPTDTMPLSTRAKVLMSAESLVSLVTVVVVAARAVNILT